MRKWGLWTNEGLRGIMNPPPQRAPLKLAHEMGSRVHTGGPQGTQEAVSPQRPSVPSLHLAPKSPEKQQLFPGLKILWCENGTFAWPS